MQEVWKDIPDYEGLYQVSDLGNVKSLARICIGGNGAINNKKERILKASVNSRGYLYVILYKNGKTKINTIHRIVWETFNNPTNLYIDHVIEGNKLDNRLCNLQAITQRENLSKSFLTKRKTSQYTGVSWSKVGKKWVSQILLNGKVKHLGLFKSEIDAANAYNDYKLKNVT